MLQATLWLSVLCSCNTPDEGPDSCEQPAEAECRDAIAIPISPIDSALQRSFENAIADLDITEEDAQDLCGDSTVSKADAMVKAAIQSASLPNELTEISHSFEWFTGSENQDPECYSFSVGVTRQLCDTKVLWSDQSIEVTWLADGTLEEVQSNCGGCADYQSAANTCSHDLWDTETCGGIFSKNGVYAFQWDSRTQQFIKGIIALCEPKEAQYFVPVCDDFLPEGAETLCGSSFCEDSR